MPELPEVETVRRTLLPHVLGRRVIGLQVHQPQLRELVDVPAFRQGLLGHSVLEVRRRAKYLLFDLSQRQVLLVHLGMSGRLGILASSQPLRKHDHVVLQLDSGVDLRLNDARRFGMVACFAGSLEAAHPRLAHLGVEPLDATAFSGPSLYQASRSLKTPIKNFLMDGKRQVGVGNIYACEALFRANIHPLRAAGRLSLASCHRLVAAVVAVLAEAIELGGTTLRDFANVQGEAGYFAGHLQVYGRTGKPCLVCDKTIKRMVQAGRSTFYCSTCQR